MATIHTHSFAICYPYTGKERDSETGLDNFGARYHGSNLGRFMTPDPENAGAEPDDPQSWNGYAYARNNPLQMIDPSGLAYCSITPAQDEDTCTEAGGTWNYEGGDPQTLKNEAGDEAEIATPSTEVTVDGDTEEVYTVNFNFSNDRPLSSTARDTFTQVGVQTGNITKQMNCVAGAIYPFIPGVHPEDISGLLLDTMGSALGIGAEEYAAKAESLRTGYKLGAGKSAMRRNVAAAASRARVFRKTAGMFNGLNLALAARDGYKNFKQCESQP
jgi:RHS repeat-associated protein